jgi:uncharacterized membrane protein
MQALSDDQRVDLLEKKMDEGFARMERNFAESFRGLKEDIREIRGQVDQWGRAILMMWLTIILGFAGLFMAILTHT